MAHFIAETFRALASGRAYQSSVGFFDLAFLIFILATVAYMIFLIARRDGMWKAGMIMGTVAAVCMTLGLALRWIAAGWAHPPFTNMYESMVFFAWGVIVVYLVLEWMYKIKIAGAFVVPLACIAMGVASLNPDKEIEPLVPALQSIWLHLHVAVASIGYAAFLAAFAFSVLFFLKDRVKLEWFVTVTSGFVIFAILAVTKGSIFYAASFFMDRVIEQGSAWTKVPIPDSEPMRFQQVPIPGMGVLMLLAFSVALVAFVYSLIAARRRSAGGVLDRQIRGLALINWLVLTVSILWLVLQVGQMPDARLASNPYAVAMIVVAWLGLFFVNIFNWKYNDLLGSLPEAQTLEGLTYKSIMVGFPLMTLVIVTGAIWANQAWGRYWGWDPKETASLVTWIIYLLYLHSRLIGGWPRRISVMIALIGFLSVVFTYLGVNLLLSGLHAYATG